MGFLFSSVSVIVNNVTHSLSNNNPYVWIAEDNMGSAPITRLVSQAAQQDGDTDEGFRLQPRFMPVVVGIATENGADLATRRDELLDWFSPLNNTSLELTRQDGQARRIDCHVATGLAMGSQDRIGPAQQVGMTLKANDPVFYNPLLASSTFSLGGGGDTFDVPTDVPTQMGASTLNDTNIINYPGSWYSWPTIRIDGPITNCVITHQETGDKLDFTGTTIANGSYYIIDTAFNAKTVVNESGTNKVADLTDDSDLATFNIRPASQAVPDGQNTINVAGSAATIATLVTVTYRANYRGI